MAKLAARLAPGTSRVQPGATRIFHEKGATRLAQDAKQRKGSFLLPLLIKSVAFASKRSKKGVLTEKTFPGATCK
ncbi:hypothetical protein [Pseudomonas sp. BNK-44-a]|uniref:hypothetical protein n=1 Tax=Pseudomonas sp. BNK-44-a TaxID=3376178 RepID=UPI0039BF6A6D